jgi:hypothetical protein
MGGFQYAADDLSLLTLTTLLPIMKVHTRGGRGFNNLVYGRGLNRSGVPDGTLARPHRPYDQTDAPIDLSTSLEAAKYNPIARNAMYMDFNEEMQSDDRMKII